MTRIAVLNGPNLDRLGTREPEIYGAETLQEIVEELADLAAQQGASISHFQSNAEHELVDRVYSEVEAGAAMALLNPGAFTHTSVALRDALLGSALPFIEVHLSNVAAREDFRQTNFFSDIARGSIFGLGTQGYRLGLQAALALINREQS